MPLMEERPMPSVFGGRTWIVAVACVSCFVAHAILEAKGHSGPWSVAPLLLTALALGFQVLRRGRRCPQCGSPLIERHVSSLDPDERTYRIMRLCRRCEIAWDLGEYSAGD
jgi:hypothetical protein